MSNFARNRAFSYRSKKGAVSRIVKDSYGDINDWRSLRQVVGQRDNYKCRKCGADVSNSAWDCHHIIPLSRGGITAASNLMCVCERCHSRQHLHMMNVVTVDARKHRAIRWSAKTKTRIR